MSDIDLYGSLSQAALALESAADVFSQQRWPTSDADPILGRQIRSARHEEIQYLDSSASEPSFDTDPAEANIHELLTILKREKPGLAIELARRWEHANFEFQNLCEQCPDPNAEFVENRLKKKLDDFINVIEAEIELLKEQVDFLDETLIKKSALNSEEIPDLKEELALMEKLVENEKTYVNDPTIAELQDETLRLETELEKTRQNSNESECQELNALNILIGDSESRLREIQNKLGPQYEHIESIRHAIRSLVQKRSQAKEPFAIALSVLFDHQGIMTVEDFKSAVGDLLSNKLEVVSLLYSMVGQGLIEIDRTIGNGMVKSCIQLI